MEKEYWRRKGFITANRLQSATEEGQGRNLEEGAEAEPTRESFFIGLFTLPCSATWLIQCRPTCLRDGIAHTGLDPAASVNASQTHRHDRGRTPVQLPSSQLCQAVNHVPTVSSVIPGQSQENLWPWVETQHPDLLQRGE